VNLWLYIRKLTCFHIYLKLLCILWYCRPTWRFQKGPTSPPNHKFEFQIPIHEDLWNNCRRCGSLNMHIQRRRIMDERILRGFVSYTFRRLVVTTRDKCGFRRYLWIYIYWKVIFNFFINRSAPFIQRVVNCN